MENKEMPIGFGMALAMNPRAMGKLPLFRRMKSKIL